MMKVTALSSLVLALTLSTAQAGEVKVKGVHLCCGMCVKAVGGALGKVDGVSNASCDRDTRTVSFAAENEKAARAGFEAILNIGLYGRPTLDGKRLARNPDAKKKDKDRKKKRPARKVDSITYHNVHLCCGGCVKSISGAFKEVKGVEKVEADREKGTLTLSGSEISTRDARGALHKAGFHGTTRKKKKDS